jgi:putative transposase
MKRSMFGENQVLEILREVENGQKVSEVCRERAISESTYFKWNSKYGGLPASDIKRLRELEEENRQLKKMYADVSLQNRVLKDLI